MNIADTFLSENEDFKFVSVVFAPYTGDNRYVYKTLFDVEVDDLFVVQTPSSQYQVVQVKDIVAADEVSDGFNYKWLVQPVLLEGYEKLKETERAIVKKLRTARIRREREDIKEEALKYLSAEERLETAKLVRL